MAYTPGPGPMGPQTQKPPSMPSMGQRGPLARKFSTFPAMKTRSPGGRPFAPGAPPSAPMVPPKVGLSKQDMLSKPQSYAPPGFMDPGMGGGGAPTPPWGPPPNETDPPQMGKPGSFADPSQFPQYDEFGRPIQKIGPQFIRPYMDPQQVLQILMGMKGGLGGDDANVMRPPGNTPPINTRPYYY